MEDFVGTHVPVSTLDIRCVEQPGFNCDHGFKWVILDASRWREVAPGPLRDLLAFVDTGEAPANDRLLALIDNEMAQANADAAWKEEAVPFLTLEDDARIQARINYEDGLAEGKAEGLAEGQQQFATLMNRLFADGRIEDAKLAAADSSAYERLREEYGLQ